MDSGSCCTGDDDDDDDDDNEEVGRLVGVGGGRRTVVGVNIGDVTDYPRNGEVRSEV